MTTNAKGIVGKDLIAQRTTVNILGGSLFPLCRDWYNTWIITPQCSCKTKQTFTTITDHLPWFKQRSLPWQRHLTPTRCKKRPQTAHVLPSGRCPLRTTLSSSCAMTHRWRCNRSRRERNSCMVYSSLLVRSRCHMKENTAISQIAYDMVNKLAN
jgi:hypothetical protein